tara:strand:- start:3499 stop:4059 length:561 start_codon:yes stop_codon:yes gene_type:complete
MPELIQLPDNLIIGKGRDRICYEHPLIQEQCIKISIRNDKQSKREMRYFKYLKSKKTDLSKTSIFLEKIKTNKGLGYSFRLIRDYDGKVSKTLLQSLEFNECSIPQVLPLISDLKDYLMVNKICVRDISPSNISCQKTKEGLNLMIIDGIGSASINPFTIRSQRLVNKSIEKAWKGLNRKLARFKA